MAGNSGIGKKDEARHNLGDWYAAASPADRRRIVILYWLAIGSAAMAVLDFIAGGLLLLQLG